MLMTEVPAEEAFKLDPLSEIRQRTRPLHEQLESRVDLRGAFASRASYMRLLCAYRTIHRPFEARMDVLPVEMRERLGWTRRRKLPLLENDIEKLGGCDGLQGASVNVPDVTDIDAALGALYVVEGSCLGGQVLYRMARSALGVDQHGGASFFFGYGESTGAEWRSFTELLRQEVVSSERAAETACDMFRIFAQNLIHTQI